MNMRQEQCNPKGSVTLRCENAPERIAVCVEVFRGGLDQLSNLLLLLLRLTGAGRVLA